MLTHLKLTHLKLTYYSVLASFKGLILSVMFYFFLTKITQHMVGEIPRVKKGVIKLDILNHGSLSKTP